MRVIHGVPAVYQVILWVRCFHVVSAGDLAQTLLYQISRKPDSHIVFVYGATMFLEEVAGPSLL
jgi:hypothetical protein